MTCEGLKKFNIEKAIPCGLIVNEILSNSFKYAFQNKLSGHIQIYFKSKSIDGYEMFVSDDGIGIPKNIDVLNSNSLGLELIHSLVDQLDGNIKISSKNGTSFKIVFPYN